MVVPSPQPGCQRSLFGRLGTPSPRKKRNNSTPTKKNAAEKKQILQQLISPNNQQRSRKVSIGELIQLSERKVREQGDKEGECSSNIKETGLSENSINSTAQITLSDPKLEKKVTFARLLNKVSAEMSSGSEVELQVMKSNNASAPSLRASSTPPSPAAEIRSPNSTSSNQGSDSLSSSDLALPGSSASRMSELLGRKNNGKLQCIKQKPASADSILQMFRNFSSTSAAANMPSSVHLSPSTTPTASTPQDDVAGDDDSTTSSIHTPVSFSSGLLDSPPNHRKQSNHTIEVPVLDALSAHKSNDGGSNFLHPPTILLEVPSMINKCLSPIREMPTPLPTPAPTPLPSPALTPVLQRSNASSSAEDLGLDFSDDRISVELPCISVGYSDDEEMHSTQDIAIDIHAEDGLIQEEAAVMHQACNQYKFKPRPPLIGQTAEQSNVTSTDNDSDHQQSAPPPLVIPTLIIQQPSPTHTRVPILGLLGSPPPHRASNPENIFPYAEKQGRRLLKDFDKPTSLDLPCAPPLITVTFNMSEAESDAESLSPATKTSSSHLGPATGNVGMCYLSPFSMCSRADRTASESNLSSSGYSSMASPGPSRCGSNNPLCPSEMEDPGPPGPGSTNFHSQLLPRRPSPLLKTNSASSSSNPVDKNSGDQRGHCRGRSDSETLSDDPLLESNDEGIGTDHIDEKIEDGELKSAKDLEIYIENDFVDNKLTVEMPKLPSCLTQSSILTKCEALEPTMDRLMPPVCKVSLQLPSIVVQSEGSGCDKHISPVSSRSESPLSDRTAGLGRFSPQFYNKQKDLLPFTDSDGLYDFPSSDCAPQNKVNVASMMQQHRKSGRKREKKSTRTLKSPTKNQLPLSLHHYHLDVPSKESHHRVQQPRKPSPKRRAARNQQIVSSSSSSESLNSTREVKVISSSSPSPDTIRWSSPTSWPDNAIARRRSHESSGEDTAEESTSVMIPNVVEDTMKQNKKISRLRTIGHQIRFLRRLEKSLKRRDHLTCPSDSIDSGDGEEFARVTSPLLQSVTGAKPEIRKSSSIGKLHAATGNTTTRFKRGKTKKGGDLLIPQEEVTWTHVLATGNGHSD